MTYVEKTIYDKFGFNMWELDLSVFKTSFNSDKTVWEQLDEALRSGGDLSYLHKIILRANAFKVSDNIACKRPWWFTVRDFPNIDVKMTKYVAFPKLRCSSIFAEQPAYIPLGTPVEIVALHGNGWAYTSTVSFPLGALSDSKFTVSPEFQPLYEGYTWEEHVLDIYDEPDINSPHIRENLSGVRARILGYINGFYKVEDVGYVLVDEVVRAREEAEIIVAKRNSELGLKPYVWN